MTSGNIKGEHVGEGMIKALRKAISLRVVGGGRSVDNGTGAEHVLQQLSQERATSVAYKGTRCSVTEEDV